MLAWDTLKTWTREVAFVFQGLATSSQDTPLIGNWCYVEFSHAYAYLMNIYAEEARVGYWLDDAQSRLAVTIDWGYWWTRFRAELSAAQTLGSTIWNFIYDQVKARWSWLDNMGSYAWDYWWPRFRSELFAAQTLGSTIWNFIYDQIKARWTWLDNIDDRIWNTVVSRWTWLNTIDDKIRTTAWDHIAPKLGDWFWAFIVLEVTLVSKIAYRVLSTLWNMEWDDSNKEAK